MRHTTVQADPPPNLLYDMKAAARIERWERRAVVLAQAARVYMFAGATAGLVALVLSILK